MKILKRLRLKKLKSSPIFYECIQNIVHLIKISDKIICIRKNIIRPVLNYINFVERNYEYEKYKR